MSAPEPALPSEDLQRLRNTVRARPWKGLQPLPTWLYLGAWSGLNLAGVYPRWEFLVVAVVVMIVGHIWLKDYYESHFGSVGPAAPLQTRTLLVLVLCALVPVVLAVRLSPGDWSFAFSADLGILLLALWWRSGFRRWHLLIWASACGGALLLAKGGKRHDLSTLVFAMAVILDSILNHLELVRLVRPVPEEPDERPV